MAGKKVHYDWYSDGIKMDPASIWIAMFVFGMTDLKMIGYWDENPVVTTSDRIILTSACLKDKRMMISMDAGQREKEM